MAFEDLSFSSIRNASEVVVYNLATDATTRITNDALMDRRPAVAPSGDAVVFEKCQIDSTGCDIHVAIETSPGVFTTTSLTGPASEDVNPDTNGTVVVYETRMAGELQHIAFVPLTGGVPTVLLVPGEQRRRRLRTI